MLHLLLIQLMKILSTVWVRASSSSNSRHSKSLHYYILKSYFLCRGIHLAKNVSQPRCFYEIKSIKTNFTAIFSWTFPFRTPEICCADNLYYIDTFELNMMTTSHEIHIQTIFRKLKDDQKLLRLHIIFRLIFHKLSVRKHILHYR